MKLKNTSILTLLTGLLLTIIGALIPCWLLQSADGTVDIIGGASMPTYQLLFFSSLDGLPFLLVVLGMCLILSSLFCLVFAKTVKAHCTIKTSGISLGISAAGALGLMCAFIWFTIVSFHEIAYHPVTYPASIILGIVCFLLFGILIALYLKFRRKVWTVKGLVIDILTSIFYLPAFFFVFSFLRSIIP